MTRPGRKAATAIVSIARAISEGQLRLEPTADVSATLEALRAIRGIGEWTAQYIAMRELREPDAFPAGDIGLLRALTASEGKRLTSGELLAMAERWRPWRAYAAQHLWASGRSGRRTN